MRDLNDKKNLGLKPKVKRPPASLKPSKMAQMRKFSLVVMAYLLVSALVGGSAGFGARKAYDYLLQSPTFKVRDVEIIGANKLSKEEILRESGVKEGQSIFTIKVSDAVKKLSTNPWIKGVTVRKQFPDKVIIRVVEREAESLVRRGGLWYLSAEGELFKLVEQGDPVDFPVITGANNSDAPDDPQVLEIALKIIQLSKKSGVLPQKNISQIILKPAGSVTILTVGPLKRVELTGDNVEQKWEILETVLAEVARSNMEVDSVNLNYHDGAAVRLKVSAPVTVVADTRAQNAGGE